MKKLEIFLAVCIFLITFGMYISTLAPTILWNDAAELATAAVTLGISHPSGYPTYIMLGKIFSYIPIGTPAYRINMMSAFFSSLSLVVLFYIVLKLTRKLVISFITPFILSFSNIFWDQATYAEVYPLHIFLFSVSIFILMKWRDKKKDYYLYILAFFIGLSLTNHLLTFLMLPAAAFFIISNEWTKFSDIKSRKSFGLKKIFLIALCIGIGLLPYLYLPLRSLDNPPIDWGNPETLTNFLRHVTGREYAYKMFNYQEIIEQIPKQTINLFIKQFLIIFGVIGIIGSVSLYKKDFRFFIFLIIILMSYLFFNLCYNIGDIIYYYLTIYFIFAICIGYGLAFIYGRYCGDKQKKLFFFILLILAIGASCAINYKIVDKKKQFIGYDYGINLLKNQDNNSIIFTKGDIDLYPLWYLTLVERKDVQPIIIDTILLSKPWYVEQLKMRKEIVITYNKTIPFYYQLKNEPEKVVNELVNNIIDNNIQNKSIYSTIFYYDQKQLDIPEKYYITPKDHLFKIEAQKSETIELNLSYRYLFDKTMPNMDRSRMLISDMCTFLAIYYLNTEQSNAAIDKFKQAIALNPKSFVAHADLAFLYFKQNDINNSLIEFKKAYQIDPKNEEIFETIRWIEEEKKFELFGTEK